MWNRFEIGIGSELRDKTQKNTLTRCAEYNQPNLQDSCKHNDRR